MSGATAYTVGLASAARRDLKKLPVKEQRVLRDAILGLKVDPRPNGCTKLTGRDAYRLRVGNYRVIYEINDTEVIVTVVRVGHRRDIYQNL
ncbi:type II toxin-antitoxin system RelE/ParE family toxin [Microbacterium soli]|uniref:Type II toxin-antitoxin system RelE/ParE family toxin n=1 Tax=Microbacterium soli TaxID=446075 RepID=A0ABP7NH07_9MICO